MSRRRAPNETAQLRSTEESQTARPSGSGSFLEARNLAITDGQFNSVQGHHANVVINLNQHSPTQSPLRDRITVPSVSSHRYTRSPLSGYRSQTNTFRGQERVPENFASSQLPVQQSNVIYQRHLELKGRGFPLWIPPANQNLPIQYRRTGVRIGDVGIITPDGGFSFLFNICLPRDDPVNPRVLPEQFSPIFPPIEATSIDKFLVFGHGSHLASTSIEKVEGNSQLPGFQFESSASEGAILTMPLGATSESLGDIAKFRRYAASNIVHWYKFVNRTLGREVKNGDIRLVVGCDKTTTWGIATFANQSRQNSCRLRFGLPAIPSSDSISNSSRYVWEYSGIADVRAGPSPGENDGLSQVDDPGDVVYENQCLFLRTLNTTLRDDIWSDIHCNSSFVDLQLQNDPHPAKGSASTASSINRASATKNKPSTLSSHTSGNRRCLDPHSESQTNIVVFDGTSAVFDSGPLSTLIDHPSKALNDILMAKVPAAHMVITHDEDWSLIASEYDTFPDPHELLEQILVSHCIYGEDGVIFLDRREVIPSGISNTRELVPENLRGQREEDAKTREEEARRRETVAREREADILKRERDAKDADLSKQRGEVSEKWEKEAKEKEGEAKLSEKSKQAALDAQKREAEANARVLETQKREAEARKAVFDAQKREEQVQKDLQQTKFYLERGIQLEVWPTEEEFQVAKNRIQYDPEKLHFAVCGSSGSGKSSFINAVRGLKNNSPQAARTGAVETAMTITRYPDLRKELPYKRLVWFDCPGAGTLEVPGWQYFNHQGLFIFDVIVLLYDARFTQIDLSIIQNCERFKIPVFIVRSKADSHIRNIMEDLGYDENDDDAENYYDNYQARARQLLIDTTRNNLEANLAMAELGKRDVFIVSSSAIYSLVTGKENKKTSLAIDETCLIETILKTANTQRYGTQAPTKNHSTIVKDNMVTDLSQ